MFKIAQSQSLSYLQYVKRLSTAFFFFVLSQSNCRSFVSAVSPEVTGLSCCFLQVAIKEIELPIFYVFGEAYPSMLYTIW